MALSTTQIRRATRYNFHQDYDRSFIDEVQFRLGVFINGEWDSQTVRAVAAWQAAHSLLVDGMVGPQTRSAMDKQWRATPEPHPAAPSAPGWLPLANHIVAIAQHDWNKNISEVDTTAGGGLAAIFRDSGWSRYGIDFSAATKKPKDWCGMAVASWYARAGLNPIHRRSFWATENVRSFFSYAVEGNTHHRTARLVDASNSGNWTDIERWHAGQNASRRWTNVQRIRQLGSAGVKQLPIAPADIVLISHGGHVSGANHITLVESYAPDSGELVTLEGNASGDGPSGSATDAVVRVARSLRNPKVLETIFGIGTPSQLDFNLAAIR